MSDRPLTLKSLSTHQELRDAVELQREIWGFSDLELLPLRLFVVATKVGGQVLGAYDGDRMVGFLLAIPGLKPAGKSYLHSHMLGVLPEYRNTGVGRMLKLRQRENALVTGVEHGCVAAGIQPQEHRGSVRSREPSSNNDRAR